MRAHFQDMQGVAAVPERCYIAAQGVGKPARGNATNCKEGGGE